MYLNLPCRRCFEREIDQAYLKPIVNMTAELVEKPDGGLTIKQYMPTNWLLTIEMEKGDSRTECAKRRAALDVWMRMIGATMNFKDAGDEELYLTVTSVRYSVTGPIRLN